MRGLPSTLSHLAGWQSTSHTVPILTVAGTRLGGIHYVTLSCNRHHHRLHLSELQLCPREALTPQPLRQPPAPALPPLSL